MSTETKQKTEPRLLAAERAAQRELTRRLETWTPLSHWVETRGKHEELLEAARAAGESFDLIVRLALMAGGRDVRLAAYVKTVTDAVSSFDVTTRERVLFACIDCGEETDRWTQADVDNGETIVCEQCEGYQAQFRP